MDSLTHITLGACVGEMMLGKRLGKKALLWGAIAQNLPDIDSVAGLFVPADRALLVHRGFTHSLFFALFAGVILAFLTRAFHHKQAIPIALLLGFFCFQLALHDLLDCCNSYGTGLLEPFSHRRFSINLLYVADPLFTLGLLVVTVLLIVKRSDNQRRAKWALTAIFISSVYLGFAAFNKIVIDNRIAASLKNHSAFFTTPAPFNCMLWYIISADRGGYFTAYSSIFDKKPANFEYHLRNDSLLIPADKALVNNLKLFAGDYYTASRQNDVIYFNVLRFGQVQGWRIADAPFALSYPLAPAGNQALVLQKGRLAGWNGDAFTIYLKRIAGLQNLNGQ